MTPTSVFEHVKAEWRNNPRLRIGIGLVVLILLFYAGSSLLEWRQSLARRCRDAADRLEHVESLVNQTAWDNRLEAAKATVVHLEDRFWRADSRGLAQAMIQNWIDDIMSKQEGEAVRVHVERAQDLNRIDGVWQVSATVESVIETDRIPALLRSIETHDRLVTIEQLNLINTDRARLTLGLRAYFLASS
jgi:hypothetical protein